MSFGERLKSARKNAGMTQLGVAELVGIDNNTISRWERDSMKCRIDYALKLAAALGVSVGYLTGETDELVEKPNLRGAKENALIAFDVVDKKVSCGCGNKYDPDDFKFNVIDRQQIENGKLAALCALYPLLKLIGIIADGDSMEPEIYEGDIVLFGIDPDNWSVGNQIVVCYEDSLFVKGIVSGGNGHFPIVLRSFNKNYPDMIVKKDQRFTILGRVLQIIASHDPKSIL